MTASAEKYTTQTLLDVQPLTPNLFTLRTSRDPGFRFRAGQFARLGVTKADGSTVWRAYSMVSSPFDEFLEFFSIVVPGGEFTSELSRLQVGDSLMVERQAFGYLTLDRFVDGRDLWLLSTGTGVAPFLSILQDFEVWEKFERIILVYSVREARELAYTGRTFGAEEARSIGLVNRVFADHESLLAGVMDLAHQIAAKSPIAVTGTKAMISYMRDHTVNDGLEYVATWNSAMLQSNDLRVAIAAHMSKQKPEFVD